MDKFRTDLKIIRQVQGQEESYIVKDPVALKYYRFGKLEVTVFKYLDGTRDHAEVARMVTAEIGVALAGPHVAGFVETIKKLNFIERSASEKSFMMLERLREERRLKAKVGAEGQDVLYQRFPLYDPDQLYNRIIKHIRFLWSRWFFGLCLAMFSLSATVIISNWDTVSAGLARLRSFESAGDVAIFLSVLFVVIIFHENGHGLTCKYYGGEVHEVGFMLIYFMPAFYANVSDAWTFQSKAAKLWVTFAGAFVELIICSIASFVWYFSAPGYLTHHIAFNLMLVAGLSSILVNMNPLIKLDGYFALIDYLEISNLSDNASKYLSALVRKYIFRAPVTLPDYKPRLKRILFIYGLLASCYRIFILTAVLLFFSRVIIGRFPEAGVFIFLFVAYLMLRKKLRSLWNGVHHLYVDKKEALMKPKTAAVTGAALAMGLGLFFFLPLPYWRRTSFVIEPAERVPVRASTAGFISSVLVKEGDAVRRGTLLAVGRDADLEQKRDSLRSQMAVFDRHLLSASGQGQAAEALEIQRRRRQLGDELAETEARLRRLELTAPADGVIVTPRLEDRVGAMLKPGEQFCEIARAGAPRVRVTVDDWDLGDVEVGAPASLRFNAASGQEVAGRVTALASASEIHRRLSPANRDESEQVQVRPAAAETPSPFEAPLTRFDAMIEVDANSSAFTPGMSGEVKIYGRRRPLGTVVWEGTRDWFRSRIWW
jgi:putative peptide zinc metalloprotease protein